MYLIIVNSISGRRKHKYISRKMNLESDTSFVSYLTHEFQGKDLWTQIKKDMNHFNDPVEGFIIIGGDGTFHAAINNLAHYNIPFGLIPAGSGNDFAKALKVPKSYKKAFEQIIEGTSERYDLVTMNNRYVHSVVGMGVDAETAAKSENSPLKNILNKLYLGRLTYLATFFTVIRSFKPFTASVTCEEGKIQNFERVWLLAIGNTSFYGGGLPICPEADPQDGCLDVVIVHNLSLFKLLLVFPSIFFRLHTRLPYTASIKTASMTVQTDREVLIQGDGESIGYTPQTVTVARKAIKVF